MHWASRVGSLDIVRLLAKGGADINVQDRWGTTPLMLTVVGENRMAAETLIELGASVDIRNVSEYVYRFLPPILLLVLIRCLVKLFSCNALKVAHICINWECSSSMPEQI